MVADLFPDLSTFSFERLVETALEDLVLVKAVAAELERRPPSHEAAERVVRAFTEGRADSWLTAVLLGRIGHESGYATAREILLSGHLGAEHAGAALARIRGERAIDDLRDALLVARTLRSRESAAAGLARVGPNAVGPVLAASIDGQIRWQTGAGILAALLIEPTVVAELFGSDNERGPKLATEILWGVVRRAESDGDYGDAQRWLDHAKGLLIEPLQRILASPATNMAPRKRRALEPWVSGAGRVL